MKKFYADLHIHSHFSIATSKKLVPEHLHQAALQKGIGLLGTGDFTHPSWLKELEEKLEPQENGLFHLKDKYLLSSVSESRPQFILTAEISNIYKNKDKVRKVHNVVLAPDFNTVARIQQKLQHHGYNISSDGRPILGLDSRDLLEMLLEVSDKILLIPAHIWTPWFSALGARSGFDSIEECYRDLSPHITAVETGLSTDQPMNRMCSMLDKYTLLSNSDAHSPDKLGRNANIFFGEPSYLGIIEALANPEGRFGGTVDLFPQEGKYHYAGHRKCDICFDPVQCEQHKNICPVCGKALTMGVINRIAELSDRADISEHPRPFPFQYIIPLREILSEIYQIGPQSKKIDYQYNTIINRIGPELNILLDTPLEDIELHAGRQLAEAIRRMRSGKVHIQEGYDGVYGQIKVFGTGETKFFQQDSLFGAQSIKEPKARPLLNFSLVEYKILKESTHPTIAAEATKTYKKGLNDVQCRAVEHTTGPAIVLAGPGTGKTHVLTKRIAHLITKNICPADRILAVTFTRRAAGEMKERLQKLLSTEQANHIEITTFHALGLSFLKKQHPEKAIDIISDQARFSMICSAMGLNNTQASQFIKQIIEEKIHATVESSDKNIQRYNALLEEHSKLDMEDLIQKPILLSQKNEAFHEMLAVAFDYILVDEYQDINNVQYYFLKLFLQKHSNLFAIGDPNQAIYGFRGASTKLIQKFQDDFPDTKFYQLSMSYRCPGNFLKAATDVLGSQNDITKEILEGLSEDVKITISEHPTDQAEAEQIARTIEKISGGMGFFSMDSGIANSLSDEEFALSDTAILCRTSRQFDCISEALDKHNIPFRMSTEAPLFRKKHFAEALNALLSIYGIKTETSSETDFSYKNISFASPRNELHENLRLILQHQKESGKKSNTREMEQLLHIIERYGNNYEQLADDIQLGSKFEDLYFRSEHVHLMTMHASKGLEFKAVFIPGIEEQLMPYTFFRDQTDREEEERLLYVAMTRSKKHLHLSYALHRHLFGRELQQKPSYLLQRINKALIEIKKDKKEKAPKKDSPEQLSLF